MANTLETLLTTYATEAQEFETAAFGVLTDRWVDTAVGAQLDGLGSIVGKERAGASDDTYRKLIRAQILLNLGGATIQEIVSVLELVLPGFDLELLQEFPAGFEIVADDQPMPTSSAVTAAAVIGQARAAGVRGLFQYYTTDPLFYLDGASGATFDGATLFSATIEG